VNKDVQYLPTYCLTHSLTHSLLLLLLYYYYLTRNLAVANRSRVSYAHKATTVTRSPKSPSKVTQGYQKCHLSIDFRLLFYSTCNCGCTSYRIQHIARYWLKVAKFIYSACIQSQVGISQRYLVRWKIEWWGYHMLKKYDDLLSRFDKISECDERTDVQNSITVLTRDKNY